MPLIPEEPDNKDIHFMEMALRQARQSGRNDEVPIGAVIVDRQGNLLAAAGNCCIAASDPSAHAEMLALRAAGRRIDNYRLDETTIYVTVEPCPMCAAALVHARVKRVVFGAFDPKGGGVTSLYSIGSDKRLNHIFEWQGGVLEKQCSELMVDFFRQKRKSKKSSPPNRPE